MPAKGLKFTQEVTERYLRDAGLSDEQIYSAMSAIRPHRRSGVQKQMLLLYDALELQVQARRYSQKLPLLINYMSRDQKYHHAAK